MTAWQQLSNGLVVRASRPALRAACCTAEQLVCCGRPARSASPPRTCVLGAAEGHHVHAQRAGRTLFLRWLRGGRALAARGAGCGRASPRPPAGGEPGCCPGPAQPPALGASHGAHHQGRGLGRLDRDCATDVVAKRCGTCMHCPSPARGRESDLCTFCIFTGCALWGFLLSVACCAVLPTARQFVALRPPAAPFGPYLSQKSHPWTSGPAPELREHACPPPTPRC